MPVMLGILILVLPLIALQTTVKPSIAMTGARRQALQSEESTLEGVDLYRCSLDPCQLF